MPNPYADAIMNPNLAAQGEKIRAAALARGIREPVDFGGFLSDPQSWQDMGRNLIQSVGAPLPEGAGPLVSKRYPELKSDPKYMEKMQNVGLAGITFGGGPKNTVKPDGKVINTFMEKLEKKEDFEDLALINAMNKNRADQSLKGVVDNVLPWFQNIDPIAQKAKKLWDAGIFGGPNYDAKWALGQMQGEKNGLRRIADDSIPLYDQGAGFGGENSRSLTAHYMLQDFPKRHKDIEEQLRAYVTDVAKRRSELNMRSKYGREEAKIIDAILNNVEALK